MNQSRYFADTRRSPYPRRRRAPVPRSPELGGSLPAITLLAPENYRLNTMPPRPLSPGDFRILPPRSAKNKMSSFVILNESLASPVASRSPSPSGRVSPFRGHGFKTPTNSRPTSRAVSPLPGRRKKVGPVEGPKIVHMDIGLPPKSPKRILKNTEMKEHKPAALKPKSILVNKPVPPPKPAVTPKLKVVNNKKPVVMSTVDKKNDKKSPAPHKDGPKSALSKGKGGKEPAKLEAPPQSEEVAKVITAKKEVDGDDPKIVSEVKVGEGEEKKSADEKKKKEELIPCYQPDKCCIVPPTMASPTPTATSTTTVPSASAVTTSGRTSTSSLSAISSAVSVSEALSKRPFRPKPAAAVTPNPVIPSPVEPLPVTITTVDEIVKSREGSASSHKSVDKMSLPSPTLSEKTRSSMVTVRAASNASLRSGDVYLDINSAVGSGDVISTTKIIRADPDLEVLSPNNLLRSSPPDGMSEPLWQNDRVANGSTPNGSVHPPQGRCRRFLSSLWRLLTYIFCCCERWACCRLPACCKRLNCKSISCKCCNRGPKPPKPPKPQKEPCCDKCKRCCTCNPCSFFKSCFSKLNCCKNAKCCGSCCKKPMCGKVKCCEGKKCCGKKSKNSKSKSKCCAKPKCTCSCKECCGKMKDCCQSCGDGINSCCRSLFCLNLLCCQKCLRKCSCCHKYKCCQKAGCCSCCNPNVKREQKQRLDKKNSRASNQSKQEERKLDPALVDHSSMMKAAIPVLPACLAWFCLLFNILIPGSGTILSGLLCLCFGKPRFSVNDTPQNRMSSLLLNIVIGVGQAFTIIFCLVGWGWSIWWGVIMVKLARKQKRLLIAEKNQEGTASTAAQNHVDPEKR